MPTISWSPSSLKPPYAARSQASSSAACRRVGRREEGRERGRERREWVFFRGEPLEGHASDARVTMMLPFPSIHTRTCIYVPIYRLSTVWIREREGVSARSMLTWREKHAWSICGSAPVYACERVRARASMLAAARWRQAPRSMDPQRRHRPPSRIV